MAMKAAVRFHITIVGDGSDTNFVATFATSPFVLEMGAAPGQLSNAFGLAAPNPTAVDNLSTNNSASVTAVMGAMNATVTFTLTEAPAIHEEVIISGALLF